MKGRQFPRQKLFAFASIVMAVVGVAITQVTVSLKEVGGVPASTTQAHANACISLIPIPAEQIAQTAPEELYVTCGGFLE